MSSYFYIHITAVQNDAKKYVKECDPALQWALSAVEMLGFVI